jgi:chromosome partitioning protein
MGHMPAKTVCFISEKGGVGKTTAVYHVAIGLTRWYRKRVLVVDADYQRGGLTGRFLPQLLANFKTVPPTSTTLFHVFQALYSGQSSLPTPTVLAAPYGVHLLQSDPRLSDVSVDKLPRGSGIRQTNMILFTHLSAIRNALASRSDSYDYVLIDTHPETSELMRSVIYASDYAVSPVKLDEQSSVGVPSAIEAVQGVIADVQALQATIGAAPQYSPTIFAGAMAMMTREYAGDLKYTESVQYRRLSNANIGIFDAYVTEGDGLRQAAAAHVPVYDVNGANAEKQTGHFRELVAEFLQRCP